MVTAIEAKVLDAFHYLHEHPEISWEETETTKYIEQPFYNTSSESIKSTFPCEPLT